MGGTSSKTLAEKPPTLKTARSRQRNIKEIQRKLAASPTDPRLLQEPPSKSPRLRRKEPVMHGSSSTRPISPSSQMQQQQQLPQQLPPQPQPQPQLQSQSQPRSQSQRQSQPQLQARVPESSPSDSAAQQPLRSHAPWVLGPTEDIHRQYILGRKPLGEPGSFGKVVLCTCRKTGVEYACKIIPKAKFAMTLDELDQFKREVEIHKMLQHPNIVTFRSFFEDPRYVYIIMELCTGGELVHGTGNGGGFSEEKCAHLLQQMTASVAYMHKMGLMHCDLKPSNFLLLNSKSSSPVKLIDFGLSKFIGHRGYFTEATGTPYFIAPEVLQGNYNQSCDMWSLGVVMFIMLYGYPPFDNRRERPIPTKDKHRDAQKAQEATATTEAECTTYAQPSRAKEQELREASAFREPANEKRIFREIVKGFSPILKPGCGPWFPAEIPISDSARDLLTKLLARNPADRLTADEALNHPWMMGITASRSSLNPLIVRAMTTFNVRCKFQTAVLQMMVRCLSDMTLSQLQQTFSRMDENGDGFINVQDLRKALKQFYAKGVGKTDGGSPAAEGSLQPMKEEAEDPTETGKETEADRVLAVEGSAESSAETLAPPPAHQIVVARKVTRSQSLLSPSAFVLPESAMGGGSGDDNTATSARWSRGQDGECDDALPRQGYDLPGNADKVMDCDGGGDGDGWSSRKKGRSHTATADAGRLRGPEYRSLNKFILSVFRRNGGSAAGGGGGSFRSLFGKASDEEAFAVRISAFKVSGSSSIAGHSFTHTHTRMQVPLPAPLDCRTPAATMNAELATDEGAPVKSRASKSEACVDKILLRFDPTDNVDMLTGHRNATLPRSSSSSTSSPSLSPPSSSSSSSSSSSTFTPSSMTANEQVCSTTTTRPVVSAPPFAASAAAPAPAATETALAPLGSDAPVAGTDDSVDDVYFEEEVQRIMQNVDVDNDGIISYDDILLSYVSLTLSQKEERLWEAFRLLDVNGDGRVEISDLISAFGRLGFVDDDMERSESTDGGKLQRYSHDELKEMLEEVDGTVSYDDFLELMWENHRVYIEQQKESLRVRRANAKKKREREESADKR